MHERGVGDDRDTVDGDAVGVGVDAPAEHRDLAVDRDPSRRDQLFGRAPRSEPGPREHLLQTLTARLGHARSGFAEARLELGRDFVFRALVVVDRGRDGFAGQAQPALEGLDH